MTKIYLSLIPTIFLQFISFQQVFANAAQVEESILKSYGCDQSAYVCKAINDNFDRDTNVCRVLPTHVDLLGRHIQNVNPSVSQVNVFDRIRYLGPFHGKYSYTFKKMNSGLFLVSAEVYFKNLNEFSDLEINRMKEKFTKAAKIWNATNPFKNIYKFEFKLALKSSNQTVSPRLVKFDTRGPYYDKWSIGWNESVIAHEFGHVLGLYDEYDYYDNKNSGCDPSSIMCSSYGSPKDYHYHLIFQRGFCEV